VECECVVCGVDEEADASEANTLVKDKLYIEGNAIVEVRGGVCFDVTLDDVAAEIFVGVFVEHTEKVAFGEVGFEFLDFLLYIGELVDGGVLLVDCDFHFCVPFLRCVLVWGFAVVPSFYHTMRGVFKGDYRRLQAITGGYPHSISQKLVFSQFFNFFQNFFEPSANLPQCSPILTNTHAFLVI
jgi:hypothetical protein